jgi:ABC-2 type transport system permease protein
MTTLAYTRFELLRTLRSKRFFVMSLGFPLAIYFLIALPNRTVGDFAGTGISAPLYYMVGLAAFGTMAAVLSSGTRIAGERAIGWNRQLRTTPLPTRTYFRTKVLTGYMMALLTIGLLYVAGIALGVRLPAADWIRMTFMILCALAPLAALGVLLGHLLTVDAIGPAVGGLTAILAFVSGTWFPLGHGVLNEIGQCLPSYWLVQASHVAVGGQSWPLKGWLVVIAWSVVLRFLAALAYRRDTQRA